VKVCEGVIKNRQIPGSRKHKQTPPHFLNIQRQELESSLRLLQELVKGRSKIGFVILHSTQEGGSGEAQLIALNLILERRVNPHSKDFQRGPPDSRMAMNGSDAPFQKKVSLGFDERFVIQREQFESGRRRQHPPPLPTRDCLNTKKAASTEQI